MITVVITVYLMKFDNRFNGMVLYKYFLFFLTCKIAARPQGQTELKRKCCEVILEKQYTNALTYYDTISGILLRQCFSVCVVVRVSRMGLPNRKQC